MNAEQLLHAGILDIIFEGRNKSYGAYPLRKHYHRRLLIAVLLIVSLSTLTFGLINLIRKTEVICTGLINIPSDPTLGSIAQEIPKPNMPKPSSAKPSMPATTTASNDINSKNLVFSNDAPKIKTDPPLITGPELIPGENPGISLGGPGSGGPGKPLVSGGGIQKVDSVDNSPVMSPEIMPSFPGGDAALIRFLQRHLEMPDALEPGNDVRIMARFVITVDGKLTSVTTNGKGNAFDREVQRVIKKMPDWIPGKTNGKNVACYFQVPVVFHVDSE